MFGYYGNKIWQQEKASLSPLFEGLVGSHFMCEYFLIQTVTCWISCQEMYGYHGNKKRHLYESYFMFLWIQIGYLNTSWFKQFLVDLVAT